MGTNIRNDGIVMQRKIFGKLEKIQNLNTSYITKIIYFCDFYLFFSYFELILIRKKIGFYMQNYKLIEVLKSLDKKEMRRLGEFAASPYFNKNENVIKLFVALSKYHPAFDNRNLTIEKLFGKIFPKDKYDYHKINNVISDLYKISEKYFSIKHFEEELDSGDTTILKELTDKKLHNIFKQKYKQIEEVNERAQFKDEVHWYNKYRLTAEYRINLYEIAPNTELELMQEEFDRLLKYSLIKLLRFYSTMIHETRQNNVEYNMRMFEETLAFLERNSTEKNKLDEPPILSVYKNSIYLLLRKERKYYDELVRLKNQYLNEFTLVDRSFIFVHLFGFIAHMLMTEGDYSYYVEAFEHHKESLELGIRSGDNISYFDFVNFVKSACSVKEFEWARRFIENYKHVLPEEEMSNTLNFSYGTIEQKSGNAEKALGFFAKTNFSNFIMKEQVKIIQCRLLYELGMDEQALSAIDTFRHYLQREKMITEDHRDLLYSFLKYLTQLIKVRESRGAKDFQFMTIKLRKDVTDLKLNIFGVRLWLLEQIDELVKQIPK